jgi:membrane protein DedA with SNARE-associated domain
VGCNLGSTVAYYIGARGGRPLAEKYGRYLLVSRRDLDRADRWFARYGDGTVFFARLLPVVRTFIALPAGVARMNFLRFNVYTFLGSLPWCLALAYAGVRLGPRWVVVRDYFHRFDTIIGVLLVAAAVWFVYTHWTNRVPADPSSIAPSIAPVAPGHAPSESGNCAGVRGSSLSKPKH